ncbi:MAG: LysR family transcriptional regulator, partial [Pseudomonadota bacterium]
MDLSQSDLGLLLALDALFEEEAVTPAAKRLGISQPAMSAQLARLRRLFDDPLLIPSGRRMVLTERARAIREPLRRHLSDLDALVREAARFDPATTDATFRVMGTDYVHAAMGPALSRRLAARAPGARLALL